MQKDKYVLLLNPEEKNAVERTSRELNREIESSAILSDQLRAQEIYNSGSGIFLKNLGIVVIEEEDRNKIEFLKRKHSTPIVYYEKSKLNFQPSHGSDSELQEIKNTIKLLESQVIAMEQNHQANTSKTKESMNWNLKLLGLENCLLQGTGISICILDTGFYSSHPDFNNRDIKGKSFVPNQNWQDDIHGHGTHCTGIAAGGIIKDRGIRYGIASKCNIRIAKVLDDQGNGSLDRILDAIDNAIEKKYQIISMSLGAPVQIAEKPNPIFEHTGQVALKNNCLIIAAAGNDSKRPKPPRPVSMPANCKTIMSVAAIDKNMKIASFSNGGINTKSGGEINISAPGVSIFSCYSKNQESGKLYKIMNGTSMATPHVSGVAALLFEKYPHLSASQIWAKIEQEAKAFKKHISRDFGKGLLKMT